MLKIRNNNCVLPIFCGKLLIKYGNATNSEKYVSNLGKGLIMTNNNAKYKYAIYGVGIAVLIASLLYGIYLAYIIPYIDIWAYIYIGIGLLGVLVGIGIIAFAKKVSVADKVFVEKVNENKEFNMENAIEYPKCS